MRLVSRIPARFIPWREESGAHLPRGSRPWTRFPATLTYILVSSAIFLTYVVYAEQVSAATIDRVVYRIPRLFTDLPQTLANVVTAPWINHHPIQQLYVIILLLLFAAPFEIHEGAPRAALVFYVSSVAAGIFAGALLHPLHAVVDAPWVEKAWERPWAGGSPGAFGIMGAVAARCRDPRPLLAVILVWEANVEFWHLCSYTFVCHVIALATGYLLARRYLPRAAARGFPPS